jgi:hypothetical protein
MMEWILALLGTETPQESGSFIFSSCRGLLEYCEFCYALISALRKREALIQLGRYRSAGIH